MKFAEKNPIFKIQSAQNSDILNNILYNISYILIDAIHFHKLSDEEICNSVKIMGHNKNAIEVKPSIYLSAHFGNWEIFPHLMTSLGISISYLYKPAKSYKLNLIIKKCRERNSLHNNWIEYTSQIHTAKSILNVIKNGESVAMLIDQDHGNGAKSIEFMGQMISCTKLPARIALKHQVPIIMSMILMPEFMRNIDSIAKIDKKEIEKQKYNIFIVQYSFDKDKNFIINNGSFDTKSEQCLYNIRKDRACNLTGMNDKKYDSININFVSTNKKENTESNKIVCKYSGNDETMIHIVTQYIYDVIASWIIAHPEQWMWSYKRDECKKNTYKDNI